MNILTDELPRSIEVDGKEYAINSNFRDCLRIILAFEDPELTDVEKQIVLLQNLYVTIPKNTAVAISQGIKFLDGGRDEQEGEQNESSPRVYSFSKDADFIFAAFNQTHKIDLSDTEYLHWWKFIALFMDLGSDTVFCNLTSLRKRVKTGKASKEERSAAKEMGDIFEIPETDDRTLEEKVIANDFMEKVRVAESKRKNGSRV